MSNTKETPTAFIAFIAGVTVGGGIALLLKSSSGKVVQKKLEGVTNKAVRKLRSGVREAQFKMSRKTGPEAYTYDGGDSFV
jgi:hypothetical protein